MSDLLVSLDRCEAVESIAETLWMTTRPESSVLLWDELPQSAREDYRARAREAVRSCLPFAVQAAYVAVARVLASEDGQLWEDLGPTARARYRTKAVSAASRYRWHLAESAYPEEVERAMGEAFAFTGQTLGQRVDETRRRVRVTHLQGDWRNEFAKEPR